MKPRYKIYPVDNDRAYEMRLTGYPIPQDRVERLESVTYEITAEEYANHFDCEPECDPIEALERLHEIALDANWPDSTCHNIAVAIQALADHETEILSGWRREQIDKYHAAIKALEAEIEVNKQHIADLLMEAERERV